MVAVAKELSGTTMEEGMKRDGGEDPDERGPWAELWLAVFAGMFLPLLIQSRIRRVGKRS